MSDSTKPASRATMLAPLLLLAVGTAFPAHADPPAPEAPAGAAPAGEVRPDSGPGVKRAVYLPEQVKAQLREEIKRELAQEMLGQAQSQGESGPAAAAVPSWVKRIRLGGDIRVRLERDGFRSGNDNVDNFDFNAINTGQPFDVTGLDRTNDRYYDTDQRRIRPRLRARVGVEANLGQGFGVGLRLASGDGSSPVSTNQTLGGSGGNFSKYQIWIDRAAIDWLPSDAFAARIGRFENPFWSTDLIWSENVNFDGLAVQVRPGGETFRPFLTLGAFPVFTTDLNYSPEQPAKFHSIDKWLYAAQTGGEWRWAQAVGLKLGAAFYYFHHVEGSLSGPCGTNLKGFGCDTDASRPSFAQKGNTYMMLRSPSDFALQQELAGAAEYQYFGLASRFRELVGTARFDVGVTRSWGVALEAEYVRNFGFKKKEIDPVALNNSGNCPSGINCPFVGGNNGYQARVSIGSPTLSARWDWNLGLAYRYLESDAVVDAFTDSDFGLGGTNLKGFILGGRLMVADDVGFTARWLSSDVVAGSKFSADVLQLDLSARY